MRKKQPLARFKAGDTVYVSIRGKNLKIVDVFWNGLMWMYSFEGDALSCGEMYLGPVATV